MAQNPFQKGAEAETGAEAEEHPIFAELEEEAGAAAAEGGEEEQESERTAQLFQDPEGEPEEEPEEGAKKGEGERKPAPPLHQRQRFQAMKRQRDAAREEAETIRREIESARPLQELVQKHYSWADNPLRELEFSANVTDILAELHQAGDAEAQAVSKKIMERIGAQRAGQDPGPIKASRQESSQAAQPDQTTLKTAERLARADIREILNEAKIEARFQRMIVPHVLGKTSNPADLDEPKILEAVQEWIRDSGFSKEELRGQKPASKPKPRMPGSGRAASGERGGQQEQAEEERSGDAPKNLSEWQKNKAKARDALFGQLGAR